MAQSLSKRGQKSSLGCRFTSHIAARSESAFLKSQCLMCTLKFENRWPRSLEMKKYSVSRFL